MIRPPITGTTITHAPSMCVAGEVKAVENFWKKNRLVKKRMACSSRSAVTVLQAPTTAAMLVISSRRAWPSKSRRLSYLFMADVGNGEDALQRQQFNAVLFGQSCQDGFALRFQVDFD